MSVATLLNNKIPSEWKGRTIASFLRVQMGLSRRTIRALKREAGIRINGEVAPVWRRLTGGEEKNKPLRRFESLKPAVTRYRVIAKTEYSTLAAVKLYTGRTHQIRVHLSHLKCPIWGDPLYGIPERDLPRVALHAVKLIFEHPRSGKRLIVKSEFPADLKKLAASLGLFSSIIKNC